MTVAVVVFVPPEVATYAPAPATTKTTTTTATIAVELIPVLTNFIFDLPALRIRFMAPRIILLLNIVHHDIYGCSIVHGEEAALSAKFSTE